MSSAVRSSKRRIMADVRELHTDPSDQYAAAPRETDIFEWDFAIRGPPGTPFEGGVYHGRIILPTEYPFKPPHIMLLTENGRWEVGKKICLSISAYHPEEWQPAWGVRTILEAIIAFMPTDGNGAIGAVDFDDAERRRLARLSQSYAHANMPTIPPLRAAPDSSAAGGGGAVGAAAAPVTNRYAAEIAQMQIGIAPTRADAGADEGGAAAAVATGGSPSSSSSSSAAAAAATVAAAAAAVTSAAAALRAPGSISGGRGGGGGSTTAASGGGSSSTARAAAAPPASKQSPAPPRQPPVPLVPVPTPTPASVAAPAPAAPAAAPAPPRPPGDQALVLIATALVIAIIAIVLRKVLRRLDVLEDSA